MAAEQDSRAAVLVLSLHRGWRGAASLQNIPLEQVPPNYLGTENRKPCFLNSPKTQSPGCSALVLQGRTASRQEGRLHSPLPSRYHSPPPSPRWDHDLGHPNSERLLGGLGPTSMEMLTVHQEG